MAFPTDHRLHIGPVAPRLRPDLQKFLAEADVILSLDWLDLGGTLKQIHGAGPVTFRTEEVERMAECAKATVPFEGRLPIGLLGDGDFLMGNTAVWTAARYRIPCLMIVCNNRSFFSDEVHQERVAIARGRPPENRWIGQRIGDPDIDFAAMARAQGATGIGPIIQPADIQAAIEKGIEVVKAGGVCVIDARV